MTSHYVDRSFDWPIAARLYLPESWVQDEARLEKGKVPGDITFKTKGEIALEIIDTGIATGLPTWAVLADAGYGDQPSFLEGLETRALPHVVGVASNYPLSSVPRSGTGLWCGSSSTLPGSRQTATGPSSGAPAPKP